MRDPNKGSTARNEGVFRKLPSQLHSHLCSDRISFDFQVATADNAIKSRRRLFPFPSISPPCKFFLFLFFFLVNFQFSLLVSRNDHFCYEIFRSWKSFVDQKLLEFADSIQCLSVQKSSILTRYYVDNVVRNLYIYILIDEINNWFNWQTLTRSNKIK